MSTQTNIRKNYAQRKKLINEFETLSKNFTATKDSDKIDDLLLISTQILERNPSTRDAQKIANNLSNIFSLLNIHNIKLKADTQIWANETYDAFTEKSKNNPNSDLPTQSLNEFYQLGRALSTQAPKTEGEKAQLSQDHTNIIEKAIELLKMHQTDGLTLNKFHSKKMMDTLSNIDTNLTFHKVEKDATTAEPETVVISSLNDIKSNKTNHPSQSQENLTL
ncbi:MAG: hypothetical protein ACRBDI_09945 [Alphaproteobacteria bacterium]